jgi:hypothetical protein
MNSDPANAGPLGEGENCRWVISGPLSKTNLDPPPWEVAETGLRGSPDLS